MRSRKRFNYDKLLTISADEKVLRIYGVIHFKENKF